MTGTCAGSCSPAKSEPESSIASVTTRDRTVDNTPVDSSVGCGRNRHRKADAQDDGGSSLRVHPSHTG
eukprot:3389561-Rhodomonas_salina.2